MCASSNGDKAGRREPAFLTSCGRPPPQWPRDGINRTAAALHLDGGKLKRRMEVSNSGPRKTPLPAFVELLAAGAASLPEYTIELEGRNGKLCIRCKGTTAADLAGLSRALWEIAS